MCVCVLKDLRKKKRKIRIVKPVNKKKSGNILIFKFARNKFLRKIFFLQKKKEENYFSELHRRIKDIGERSR